MWLVSATGLRWKQRNEYQDIETFATQTTLENVISLSCIALWKSRLKCILCIALNSIILYCFVLHCSVFSVLYGTCIMFSGTFLYCLVLYCSSTIVDFIVLRCAYCDVRVLSCRVLYSIALCCTASLDQLLFSHIHLPPNVQIDFQQLFILESIIKGKIRLFFLPLSLKKNLVLVLLPLLSRFFPR